MAAVQATAAVLQERRDEAASNDARTGRGRI